jgi:hypothetical protein
MTAMNVDLINNGGAHSICSLPRLRGRDREGACKNVERACKKAHVQMLTPSPTLPRTRGREQTEFAARITPAAAAEPRLP